MTTSEQTNAGQADGTGQRIVGGRYRLAEQIGRGAMGTVWRARDELLDRDVAIKDVRLPLSVSAAERDNSYQRTLREARTAARLSHPGVAAVYDVVEESGRPWIVMELVNGRSLNQVVAAEGRLSPQAAAMVGRQVLAALAAAHLAGVLHRDVKPSNVLLTPDGRAVLTDFGIATAEGDPSLTQTGMVLGSPGFLAPERIRGDTATPASDLWSLGATLYAAVEGRGPYERGGGAMTTLAAVVTEEPPPPRAGGALNPVLHALLTRDPAGRPSATAAAQMLDAVATSGPGHAVLPRSAAAAAGAAAAAAAAGPGMHASRGGTRPLAQTLPPSAILPPGAAAVGPASMGPAPGAGRVPPGRVPHSHNWIITFVIIGAAIFFAAAVAAAHIHRARGAHPVSALPTGFRWYSQRPGSAGAGTAGFSVAVPDSWQVSRAGVRTVIREPGGSEFLELDLTPHHDQGMVAELYWLQRRTRLQGTFPSYHLSYIRPVRYQGTVAADWAFSWRNQSSGRTNVLDRAWIARGPAAGQSFAIYWSTPATQWRASQPVRTEFLSTFRPLP